MLEELHNTRIDFGPYRGQLWTRLNIGYLKYLARTTTGSTQAVALLEMERRGITPDDRKIEITMHAIDRASLKLLDIWEKERKENEGLAAWLARVALEALEKGVYRRGRYEHRGMRFVIKKDFVDPVLVSVYLPIHKP